MLILDKQKAVERIMALTMALTSEAPEAASEPPAPSPPTRIHQGIASYERRASAPSAPPRRATARERRGIGIWMEPTPP